MKAALSYVKSDAAHSIIELSMWLQEQLRYPNSENSLDERRYTEWFEERLFKIINKHMEQDHGNKKFKDPDEAFKKGCCGCTNSVSRSNKGQSPDRNATPEWPNPTRMG